MHEEDIYIYVSLKLGLYISYNIYVKYTVIMNSHFVVQLQIRDTDKFNCMHDIFMTITCR